MKQSVLIQDVIDKYFTGTVSRIGGVSLKDIENDVETLHSKAFDPLGLSTDTTLDSAGAHKMRSGKEEHLIQSARPFIYYSMPQERVITILFKEYTGTGK